jgi:cytochrome b561
MLAGASRPAIKVIDGWHQALEWALLIVAFAHIASVLVHRFVYRDQVLQRMLPG